MWLLHDKVGQASDPNEAEKLAVDLVRKSSELKESTLNQKEDPPMIYLEAIAKVGLWEFLKRNPGGGFTFYPEDATENETV